MGGFGSGRHGGTVTAEGTASYIIAISSLRSFLQKGPRPLSTDLYPGYHQQKGPRLAEYRRAI